MGYCKEYKSSSFHGIVENGRPDGFWYLKAAAEVRAKKVFICEAAIDAISLYEIQKRGTDTHNLSGNVYVSIGGAGKQEAINRIRRSGVEQIIIATDNDEEGEKCRQNNSDLPAIIPTYKDWNDDLRHIKGMC